MPADFPAARAARDGPCETDTYFLSAVGLDSIDLSRSSLAAFEGPVPMGSPEHILGDDPLLRGSGSRGGGRVRAVAHPALRRGLHLRG